MTRIILGTASLFFEKFSTLQGILLALTASLLLFSFLFDFSDRLIRTDDKRLEKDLNKIVLTKLSYCPKENIWKNGRFVTPIGNPDACVSILDEKKMKLEASKFL